MRVNFFFRTILALHVLVLFSVSSAMAKGQLQPISLEEAKAIQQDVAAKVALGKKLFFDRRLSGDGTMSCASCHMPDLHYTDGEAISLNYPTTRNWRNAPTLINLAYNQFLFHDGRASSIEEQALFPIMSAFEMNQNLDYLEEEIRTVPEYVADFEKSFGDGDVSRERIGQAIAAFERTLVSGNAPLDKYLLGSKQAFTPEELHGFTLFTGKGKCIQCHFGPNLNDNKFHAHNVPEHPDLQDNPRVVATLRFVAKLNNFKEFRSLSEDLGRYLITKDKKDWKAFRTPTLRDISKTGPYMHNGVFKTLEETIDFYNKGGGQGSELSELHLSENEKKALLVFLRTGLRGEKIPFEFPMIP